MSCPNINLEEWKLLVASRGEDVAYALWDLYDGNVPESESKIEIIKSGLKATNILQSPKADQFFNAVAKNKITGDFFWKKMQADLGIPKDQIEILKSFNTQDRGELISSLLGNYSFAIEINVARSGAKKDYNVSTVGESEGFELNGDMYDYFPIENVYYKNQEDITKEEYEKAKSKISGVPTQYYSNLTVPGGTNYTENEIATPAITPSIKGHAQFATDKGIGWFRSDDKSDNEPSPFIDEPPYGDSLTPSAIKTRRILEVQSDLFQKGRGKEDLVTKEGRGDIPINQLKELNSGTIPDFFSTYTDFNGVLEQNESVFKLPSGNIGLWQNERYNSKIKHLISGEEQNIHGVKFWRLKDNVAKLLIDNFKIDLEKEIEDLKVKKSDISKNEFLQLLNKDNNWVTFFVKSIIQDSAKKGYEKVLFPSGNTASKVEGHTTLEEFKKQKEDRIKALTDSVNNVITYDETFDKEKPYLVKYQVYNDQQHLTQELESFKTKEEAKEFYLKNNELSKDINNEINQLKQELERVEGPEGFGALKPIYNFYENTVKNVLNKQYGKENVKQVTDEYGNTWNEVEIIPEREQQTILLQTSEMPASKANSATLDIIKTIATKMGISIEGLDQYVKDAGLKIESNVVGLSHIQRTADGVKATIALAEGMENQALVEEYVHIARAMVEQVSPGIITSMISKIDRFKIYDKVLKQYRENPKYQLANGKPDIRKIKMEAVDKLITELIINDSEGSTEFPELMEEKNRSMIRGWWNTLLDTIRGLYSKSNIDIFKSTAQIIGSGNIDSTLQDIKETALFYQLKDNTAVDNVYNKFKEEGDKLKGPIPATVDAAGKVIEARHYIYDNITKIFNTVSQLAKGKNKDKFVRTELQKIEDDQKKDWGSEGHMFVDKFISKNLIDKNGYKLTNPNEEVIDTRIEPLLRKKLETFAKQLINSYPPGTRFLTEKMVVNTKVKGMIASTIDFIAIAPNDETGVKVDVYDWKFTNINRDINDEIPPFKMKEWNAQMEEYRIMLINYGIKREQLRYTRMIPFITNYNYAIVGDKKSPLVLTGLEVGNPANPNANTIYTLPVPTASELTGNERVDRLLSSLRAQWEKLYKLGVEPEEKNKKKSQLQQLSIAIRNLQVKMNFAPLSAIAKTFFNNAADVIIDFENIKYDELTGDEIEAKLGKLIEYRDSTLKFVDLDQIFLSAYPKESLNEDGKKTWRALEENSATAKRLMKKITSLQKEYAMYLAVKKGIVTKENKKSVTFAEKAINGLVKNFYEGTQLPAKLIKLVSNLILNSTSLVSINVARKIDQFQPMLIALEKEASAKGKSAFDMIGKMTGKGLYLIKKINPEFWKAYSNALENKDKKFLLENMDVEKYNELAKSALKTEIDNINRTVYDNTDEDANANTREFKIRQAKDSLDINRPTFNGYNDWMFTHLFNKALLEEKHLSNEFKELQKNKAAYDVWNFFTELNERAKKAGYLQKQGSSFFPLVEATILQKMEQSGNVGGEVLKALKDIYTTTIDESTSLSKIDFETGELDKQIPRFFTMTSKPVESLSKDLNKVGTLWIKALYEYENNKNLENTLLTLAAVEKEKGSIITDENNNPVFDGEQPRVNYGKNDNFAIIQTIINDHLYGQTEDTGSLGSALLSSAVGKVNQGEDKELVEKRVVNVKKGIKSMDTLVRALAVGLKPLISLANAFGFNFQAYINSGRMYKYSEFIANTGKIVTGLGLTNEQKAVLHLINPLNEDVSLEKRREIAKEIGLKNWLSTWSFSDVMMSTNSFPEKRLQYASALSFIENSMIENGKIVNIRQYLTEQDRQTKYKSTETERKVLEKSFEERVVKLKETRSLDKSVKIEDNNITIPGVNDEELAKFRTIIIEYTRDLNGQMSQDNKANFARDTVFRSFMMFKTWIPKQVILRTKDVVFNIEKGHWEYGRGRAFLKTIAFVGIRNIHTIQDIIAGNEAGLKKLDEMLQAKRDDYFKKTGEQLIITDEEFYDLMRTELTNQMKELKLLFGTLAIVFAAGAAIPDDDDSLDDVTRNRYKYLMKAMNKIQDELSFYYNPISMESMTKGSIIPSLGLLLKAQKILTNVVNEAYGYATNDEEMMKKAHPLKYTFNIMPGFYQVQTEILPYVFPEIAKDMGIRVTAESRQR